MNMEKNKNLNAAVKYSISHGEPIMVGNTKYCGRAPGYQIIDNSNVQLASITNDNLRYVKGIPYVNVDKLAKRLGQGLSVQQT